MICLLSPAKRLDLDSPLTTSRSSQPRLLDHAEELAGIMATKSAVDLRSLMGVSEEIATLNVERYRQFAPGNPPGARPAALTFDGAVYRGMDPRGFDSRDWTEAQKTVRILSGLYGLLRPLDLIQPYRLEMGTPLRTDRGRDLVSWWGTTITDLVAADLDASPGPRVVVNLALAECWAAIDESTLDATVVSPRFEDRDRQGRWKVISFSAKTARGRMAGWLVRHRLRTLKALTSFDDGYRHVPEASTARVPVFRRL